MEGEGEVLFGSIPGPQGPQNLVFTCPSGSLGRGAHPDNPPPTSISATATLMAPTVEG